MKAFKAAYILGLALFPALAYCETYTMETYYPSPVGVYTNMTVTSTTVLARDGGAVNVGTPAKPAKLDVNGDTRVTGVVVPGNLTADPADPAQRVEGAIYFNTTSKRHRVFQNGAWADLGGGGELLLASDIPCNAANDGKKALYFYPGRESTTDGDIVYPGDSPSLYWATCKYSRWGTTTLMVWVWVKN